MSPNGRPCFANIFPHEKHLYNAFHQVWGRWKETQKYSSCSHQKQWEWEWGLMCNPIPFRCTGVSATCKHTCACWKKLSQGCRKLCSFLLWFGSLGHRSLCGHRTRMKHSWQSRNIFTLIAYFLLPLAKESFCLANQVLLASWVLFSSPESLHSECCKSFAHNWNKGFLTLAARFILCLVQEPPLEVFAPIQLYWLNQICDTLGGSWTLQLQKLPPQQLPCALIYYSLACAFTIYYSFVEKVCFPP